MIYFDLHTHHRKKNGIYSLVHLEESNHQVCSAGIHPWHINDNYEKLRAWLARMMKNDEVVALGEVGIDRAINTSIDFQERIFCEQVELYGNTRPVILHCVRAYSDMLRLKKNYKKQTWIFHNYSSSVEMTERLVELGCYFSLGKNFLKGNHIVPPIDRIFLETDENELSIEEVYAKASSLIEIEKSELVKTVHRNKRSLFGEIFEEAS